MIYKRDQAASSQTAVILVPSRILRASTLLCSVRFLLGTMSKSQHHKIYLHPTVVAVIKSTLKEHKMNVLNVVLSLSLKYFLLTGPNWNHTTKQGGSSWTCRPRLGNKLFGNVGKVFRNGNLVSSFTFYRSVYTTSIENWNFTGQKKVHFPLLV